MTLVPRACCCALLASLVACGDAGGGGNEPDANEPGRFTAEVVLGNWLFAVESALTHNFYLYVPEGYEQSMDSYPLLIVLHGDDGDRRFVPGPTPAMLDFGPLRPLFAGGVGLDPNGRERLNPHVRRSFVVYPKVARIDDSLLDPLGYFSSGSLDQIVDYVSSLYRVDPHRLYVTGLSFGGGGTFLYLHDRPDRVAAIVPISNGLYHALDASDLQIRPTWLFHSFDDTAVPYDSSINPTLEAMTGVEDIMLGYPFSSGGLAADDDYTVGWSEESGLGPWRRGNQPPTGIVNYTLYRSGGHDAWTRAYANEATWEWLYSRRRE